MTEFMSGALPLASGSLPPTIWTFATQSDEETKAAAACLGALLEGGEVMGLVGDLGAGKTCFVQGLARGLGVPGGAYVSSPTFSLISLHSGRVPLCHVDLYRLADPEEAIFVGYEDLFDGEAVVAIEWFERFPELWPAQFLSVVLLEGASPSDGAVVPDGAQPNVGSPLPDGPPFPDGSLPRAGSPLPRAFLPLPLASSIPPGLDPMDEDALGRLPRVLQVAALGERHMDLVQRWRASL